jgi:hypothetical protein
MTFESKAMEQAATDELQVVKASGQRVPFSLDKLRRSLERSGADAETIDNICHSVANELYPGISTKEIYHRAFALLKKKHPFSASKYKLKKAIYELGPTGFPFEKFIAALFKHSGYQIAVGKILEGACVSHEIDVVARKKKEVLFAECKFHSDEGKNCDVKIPLYIYARFQDVFAIQKNEESQPGGNGWVITNTRFTKDALQYAQCVGLHMLSWDYPNGDSLKDRIDRLGLYPITVSTLLSKREKQFLLSRDVVLCRQLLKDRFYLDHLGISSARTKRILDEVSQLCETHAPKHGQ